MHMQQPTLMPWCIQPIHKSYLENGDGCSLRFILMRGGQQWHVKIALASKGVPWIPNTAHRQRNLQDLGRSIDFNKVHLFNDSVTEINIKLHNCPAAKGCRFVRNMNNSLCFEEREEPSRIRFPLYRGSGTLPKHYSQLVFHEQLGPSVFVVQIYGQECRYAFRQIERQAYAPHDTLVIEQELANLERVKHELIVGLVAPVVSPNPYQTTDRGQPPVLRGFLMDYHPNGNLNDALERGAERPWLQWAHEISAALQVLHQHDIAHMNLQPSNIVITERQNIVLVDISGIGAPTRTFLSPEMVGSPDPLSESLEMRKRNDVWALGQILDSIAIVSGIDAIGTIASLAKSMRDLGEIVAHFSNGTLFAYGRIAEDLFGQGR